MRMNNFITRVKRLTNQRFFKFGLPFLILVVGGSFGVKEFAVLRYQFRNTKMITREEAEKHGVSMKKPEEVTLETEFEKIKKLDIDNWENIRGPRPWEEDTLKGNRPQK